MCGQWDFTKPLQPNDVSKDLAAVFEKTMNSLCGASYKMLQLSGSQAGARNFLFICEQTLVTNPPVRHYVTVLLHLEGAGDKASIVNIARFY